MAPRFFKRNHMAENRRKKNYDQLSNQCHTYRQSSRLAMRGDDCHVLFIKVTCPCSITAYLAWGNREIGSERELYDITCELIQTSLLFISQCGIPVSFPVPVFLSLFRYFFHVLFLSLFFCFSVFHSGFSFFLSFFLFLSLVLVPFCRDF